MRIIIKIIIVGILFCGLSNADTDEIKSKTNNNSVTSIEFIDFSLLSDGGTMGFIFKDHEGKVIKFCFDGRLNSSTRGELFIGDNHPANAQIVKRDSDESANLISLLEEYVNSIFKDKNINIDSVLSDKERVAALIKERIGKYINNK